MINEAIFRITAYVFFGFFMEVTFSVWGIEKVLGVKIDRRVPRNYLEGFISLYMIPIHGLGMFFGFEWLHLEIASWPIYLRFVIWSLTFTGTEILTGMIYHKILGHYPWDYYRLSPFKIFKEGYSLWTLVPLWGVAGLILERYSDFLIFLSPYVSLYLGR